MKHKWFIFVCCILVLTIAACQRQSGEADDGSRIIRIAWADDTLDQTRAVMLRAVEDRVAYFNAQRSDIRVILTYYDAQATVEKQLSDVETALLTRPDVFIFSSVDTVGSIPAVERIHAAGIPIVDIRDMGRPDLVTTVFFGADEVTYAAAMTEWIRRRLAADPSLVLNTGIIYGAAAQTAQFARGDLIKRLAEEMPDRVRVIAERYGNWDTVMALNITEDWIQSHPNITYVLTANDIMALGASNALVAARMKDRVMVTGVDLTDEGIALIKEGNLDASVGARLQDYGLMVDVALGIVEGTFSQPTYTIEAVYVVDSTNADAFIDGTIRPFFDN